ncbi:hypothetical protein Tco_1038189 [Tanacetum coccineum]
MKEFTTNDQEDYYLGITCITVNGKNAYELKGKFLYDLHNNAFDGTNRENVVKHIEYFLRVVDPIDLPNKMGSDEIEPTDDESSGLEETDHDDEQEIGEIYRIETNLNDGFCNGGNLPGAYIYEWYEALEDSELKEDALRNKAIMEGLIDDDNDDESHHEADEIKELCEIHELPVCTIRRFKMIEYSFRQDNEYVSVKENKYDDLARANENACRAYQEIFCMMDEGWMDLGSKEISTNIGGEFTNLEILKCWSLKTSR